MTDETINQRSIDAVVVRCPAGCVIGHVHDVGAPDRLGWWIPESKNSNRSRHRDERAQGDMTGGDPLRPYFLSRDYDEARRVIGECREHGSTDIPARELVAVFNQAIKEGRRINYRVDER